MALKIIKKMYKIILVLQYGRKLGILSSVNQQLYCLVRINLSRKYSYLILSLYNRKKNQNQQQWGITTRKNRTRNGANVAAHLERGLLKGDENIRLYGNNQTHKMPNRDAETASTAPEAAPTWPEDPAPEQEKQLDVNAVKQEAMDRLQKLLNEYETLEIKEDKLLKLLEKIRGEEGHLQRALEDPLWDGLSSSRQSINASNSNNNNNSNLKAKSTSNSNASNAIDQKPPSNFATTKAPGIAVGTATPHNPATPAFPQHTITIQPIHKQQQNTTTQASKVAASNVKTNSIRQLQQQREQRVLARQKLEDALLNEDDDASSSSGINTSVVGMQLQQQHLTKQQLSPEDSTTKAGCKRKRQEPQSQPQHQSLRKKTGIQLQKEQRILERQRLEDALLGDGNSDSDDSDNDSPAIVYVWQGETALLVVVATTEIAVTNKF